MTITDITKSSKQFKDTHTLQVGGFKDKTRVNTVDLILSVKEELLNAINKLGTRIDRLEEFSIKQEQFNKLILDRIDNLVSKNNLKE